VLTWAAFYSDSKHEVLPVESGYRITLTYNLRDPSCCTPVVATNPPTADASEATEKPADSDAEAAERAAAEATAASVLRSQELVLGPARRLSETEVLSSGDLVKVMRELMQNPEWHPEGEP
jgi:hypothetical protein